MYWMPTKDVDYVRQIITRWSGIRINTRKVINAYHDDVAYLPTIDALPTEQSTVNEIPIPAYR